MTKEEIIKELESIDNVYNNLTEEQKEAISQAIEIIEKVVE